ncbi:MAG: GNAT family N-acetyltransferase [Desulfobacula sp.]|jgi:GNAT superfamily N-acetyltransferase|nr:GNAT family N-acetyltransferase [Desulfobacula sp.]
MNVNFKIATKEDAEKLTIISVNSFNTDFDLAGRKSIGGPPGYDSTEFHERMIEEASKFYKITIDNQIIGGFWFIEENIEKAYLYRIFVDSKFYKKGIGLQSFNFLFQNFPRIKEWSLQTPIWNTRTPKFYKKLGFEVIEKTDRFLFLKRK